MAMESEQGKLFIGGISWETTEEKLKSYFSLFGEVVEAVIMKDRATGRARGFGFIVFANPMVADRVVLDKHSIDGRMVEAKKAVPRDGQHCASRTNNGSAGNTAQSCLARTKKIFVGGLASSVTENEFKRYFGQFGNVTDVVVMYDHGTRRPRGFGFITYESEESVDKVLQKTFHELNEKMVEVKRAIPKESSAGSTRSNGIGFGAGPEGRGSPYTGNYGHTFIPSPITPYVPQIHSRYGLSPISDRALFSPYGASGQAKSRGYNGLFNVVPNPGVFGGSSSRDGAIYGSLMQRDSSVGNAYGAAFNSDSFYNAYNSSPGRNLRGGGEVIYDSLNDSAGCELNWASSLNSLNELPKWGTSQTANRINATCENNNSNYEGVDGGSWFSYSAPYGGENTSRGNPLGGRGSSRSNGGSSMFLEDIYNTSGFGDSTWRTTPADKFRLASATYGGPSSGVYGSPRSQDGSGNEEQAVENGYIFSKTPTYRSQ